jgi:hypothetical protein
VFGLLSVEFSDAANRGLCSEKPGLKSDVLDVSLTWDLEIYLEIV